MYVQDLFKQCDLDATVQLIAERARSLPSEESDDTPLDERQEQTLIDNIKHSINIMKNMTPIYSDDDILCCVDVVDDEEHHYDVCSVKKQDVLSLTNYDKLKTYGVEFNQWETTLGYIVSETALRHCDFNQLTAEVFWEITFFGILPEEHESKLESVKHDIEEAQAEIENGTAKYRTMEEVFSEIGYVDTRTEAEKQRDWDKLQAEMKLNHEASNRYFAEEKTYLS